MSDKQFRFQDLEILKRGTEISGKLLRLADDLEKRHYFLFAEQLRGATLSITNNIAEGSGSVSDTDFANFLNISRRSVFEVANILMVFSKNSYLSADQIQSLLAELVSRPRNTFTKKLRASPFEKGGPRGI
jgi:four helix bundle protein